MTLPRAGVFAVSREFFDDPDFDPEPFTQREAFLWLVAKSAWKPHRTRGALGSVDLERGEFCFSVRYLAERWKWSKSRVDRFISALEKRDTIRDASRDKEKIWKINKYNDFQILSIPKRDSDRDRLRDASGTEAGHERDKEGRIRDIKGIESSSLRSEARQGHGSMIEEGPPAQAVSKRKTGSRLSPDWVPSEDELQFALTEGHDEASARREADKFRDFWIAKTGQGATKMDWTATWKNWIRNSKERRPGSHTGRPEPPKLTAFQQRQADNIAFLDGIIGKPYEQRDDIGGSSIDLGPEDFSSRTEAPRRIK